MNFKVNDHITIKNFKRTGILTEFRKWGGWFTYEKFEGELNNEEIVGWICLFDNNIYQIERKNVKQN